MISFIEAILEKSEFVVNPYTIKASHGFFTNSRVDRSTVPDGWYAYDIRHDDEGDFVTLEAQVLANHAGTFLTPHPVKLNSEGYFNLCDDEDDYNWSFI